MDCVVLAGGTPRPGDSLYPHTQGAPKALLPLAGRPMVSYVLEALVGAACIDRVLLVGPQAARWELPRGVELVPGTGGLVDNLYTGISRLRADRMAAFCWSDIPLVRPDMIDRFVERCPGDGVDVCAGVVARRDLQARYPDKQDLWLRFRDGHYLAADFGLFAPRHAARLRPVLERLAPLRKSALRQAWTVGLPLVVQYLTGRLTLAGLASRIGRRYQLRCRIQVVRDPELGLDVDAAADLQLVRARLAAT